MGAVKQMLMDDADNILSVIANKLMDGEFSEDDALEVLEKNVETLNVIGLEDKYDALAVIYEMTHQLFKDINGEM
jgi:hypothetical protein|tara:strand:+ start:464 stop:688 length:225 start_codon:yes stop_codon:yes gene_type:complete